MAPSLFIFYILKYIPGCSRPGLVWTMSFAWLILFAPSSSLRVRSWLHPFWGHCEQKNNARRGGYLCRWSSATE